MKNTEEKLEIAGLEALANDEARAVNGGGWLEWGTNVSRMGLAAYFESIWRAATSW